MNPRVFLSHNHRDKVFVRKLARDLEAHGVKCWLDEADMKIGDSLIQKIREGIDNVDYFAVILSPHSVEAPWVVNELDIAMNLQISRRSVKVLPIMLKECIPPGFLLGKVYADFQDEALYEESFKSLIKALDIVFNKSAMRAENSNKNFSHALDKSFAMNLPLMPKPFHRPLQYIGLTIQKAEEAVGEKANKVGNILVESGECEMLLESEGNYVNYVDVKIKRTAPQYLDKEFDSEVALGALSINPSELDLARKKIHSHTYYDHRRKLKINVLCPHDESPLCVTFSSKYYGD